jgi:replicative DNA helicase
LNPEEKFEILSFEFEMLVEDQLARFASSKTGKSVKEIYSGTESLADKDFELVQSVLEERKKAPIFYVDNAGTTDQIRQTILTFAAERQLLSKGMGLVVTVDHVLLTKGKASEAEKEKIDSLMEMLNDVKKYFAHIGLRCITICLSQLNREIEKPERIDNPSLHFPNRNDIFAASSIYHTSDYVLISHRPADITGISKGYGPKRKNYPDGYPLKYPDDPSRDMVYWHLIKERFGKPVVIALAENFNQSKIEEVTI